MYFPKLAESCYVSLAVVGWSWLQTAKPWIPPSAGAVHSRHNWPTAPLHQAPGAVVQVHQKTPAMEVTPIKVELVERVEAPPEVAEEEEEEEVEVEEVEESLADSGVEEGEEEEVEKECGECGESLEFYNSLDRSVRVLEHFCYV